MPTTWKKTPRETLTPKQIRAEIAIELGDAGDQRAAIDQLTRRIGECTERLSRALERAEALRRMLDDQAKA